jgi:hypothetical protein
MDGSWLIAEIVVRLQLGRLEARAKDLVIGWEIADFCFHFLIWYKFLKIV